MQYCIRCLDCSFSAKAETEPDARDAAEHHGRRADHDVDYSLCGWGSHLTSHAGP